MKIMTCVSWVSTLLLILSCNLLKAEISDGIKGTSTEIFQSNSSVGFKTIINSPPDTFRSYGYIDSNTQVNLLPGGVLPSYYNIGSAWNSTADNVEINLLGGVINGDLYTSRRWDANTNVSINLIEGELRGSLYANNRAFVTLTNASVERDIELKDSSFAVITGGHIDGGVSADSGSLVQVSGGEILDGLKAANGSSVQFNGGTVGYSYGYLGRTGAESGSTFLMTNGVINGALVGSDSYLSISGGNVKGDLSIGLGSTLDWSGGSAGPIHVGINSNATLFGNHFKIDGIPVEGLTSFAQEIALAEGSVLTGVLSDGTPIALTETGFLQDHLEGGTISLSLSSVPSYEKGTINAPLNSIPNGLRSGQTLVLDSGGIVPANFTALPGTEVRITGGEIGNGFEAVGANVTLEEGHIGERAILLSGATLKATNGSIGGNFELGNGSRFEMAGGTVGSVFKSHPGSDVIYSGGHFRGFLQTSSGSNFTVKGSDFYINGTPVGDLQQVGSSKQVDLPQYSILSGTLSDGSPFVLGRSTQWFAQGSLALETTEVPSIDQTIFRVPKDEAPKGLRSGQILLLDEGGEIPDYFVAGNRSVVRISGGHVGNGFQAVGSLVNVDDGLIKSLEVFHGSIINQNGGRTERVAVNRGGILNVKGGKVKWLRVQLGGQATISGGHLEESIYVDGDSSLRITGGNIARDIQLREGASLTIDGGFLHDQLSAYGDSQINFYGARLGDGFFVSRDSKANIYGSSLRINGDPLPTDPHGSILNRNIELEETDVLSGVFLNGTPFAFSPSDGDNFQPGSLQVTYDRNNLYRKHRFEFTYPIGVFLPDGLRPEQELILSEGENVGINFNAGWGSKLTIAGGEIGNNFEAVGATVELFKGSIGDDADIFFGSELNIEGGSVGKNLQIHNGAVVNLNNGSIQSVAIRNGGILNITGGMIDEFPAGEFEFGRIALEDDAELNIVGKEIKLNGEPIAGLTPGNSTLLDLTHIEPLSGLAGALESFRATTLSGTLLDGSDFAIRLTNYPKNIYVNGGLGYGVYGIGRYTGDAIIHLTLVQNNPEPTSAILLTLACGLASFSRQQK